MDGQVVDLEDGMARARSPLAAGSPPVMASDPATAAARPATPPSPRCRGRPRGRPGWRGHRAGAPSPMIRPPARQTSRSTTGDEGADDVLDPDHGDPVGPGRAWTISTSWAHLGVGQPTGDLVEEQQPRPRRERAGRAPAACAGAGRAGRPAGSPRPGGRSRSRIAAASSRLARPRVAGRPAGRRPARSRRRSSPRTAGAPGRCGRCRGGSARRRRAAVTARPSSRTTPRSGARSPDDDPEQAGLAGAVRPDDPDGIAGPTVEIDRSSATTTRPKRFETLVAARGAGGQGQAFVGCEVAADRDVRVEAVVDDDHLPRDRCVPLLPLDADRPHHPDPREGTLGEVERPADPRVARPCRARPRRRPWRAGRRPR